MLWMLLVYVVASNGYAGNPTLSSSFHGATFATKEACLAAAQSVSLSAPSEDIAKTGLVTVCAPAQPPPPDAPPTQALSAVPMQQSPFPAPPARAGH